MKKAVLFDLDNTLYDYEKTHKKALNSVFEILKKHINISKKSFFELYKISRVEINRELAGSASSHNRTLYFQRLIEKTHNTVEPDLILKLYDSYWNTFLKHMSLKKDVISTFKILKKNNIKIAIVTDLTTNIQLKKLSKLKLTNFVDVLVTSEEAGSEKPNPIMFLLTLNKLNLLPSEALMVGDNIVNDIEGGNAVGLDTVLVLNNNSKFNLPDEDYKKPNYVIKNIREILKILKL